MHIFHIRKLAEEGQRKAFQVVLRDGEHCRDCTYFDHYSSAAFYAECFGGKVEPERAYGLTLHTIITGKTICSLAMPKAEAEKLLSQHVNSKGVEWGIQALPLATDGNPWPL